MKKLIVFSLILLALTSFVFADDAKVMPMMVGRVYVAPTFAFIPGGYNTDGEYDSLDEPGKLFNLGFALEYGVIDWITAAVQWAPGWTPWSDVTGASDGLLLFNPDYSATPDTNGLADLFVGAKLQFVGEQAPVQNNRFRVAIAPGVIIPLPGPDFKDVPADVMANKAVTANKMDNHVFGAGARLYFDWVINESIFINFYNETIFYPIAQDLNKDSPSLAGTKAGLTAAAPPLAGEIAKIEGDVAYKYRLTFEIEPVFTKSLSNGVSFSAGLPVAYKYIPAYEYSFEFPSTLPSQITDSIEEGFESDPQHIISVKPNVSIFLTNSPLPLEFKLQYQLPVWGKNSTAQHAVTLQVKAYFALPGRPE